MTARAARVVIAASEELVLYLAHHGDAVGPEVDTRRPLSERGAGAVQRLARAAAERGVAPDVIWHSGKLRARQTAEAFWHHCNRFAELAMVNGLQPADPASWIVDRLAGDRRDILVVGHLPNLARIRESLCRFPAEGSPDRQPFPPHGLVALVRAVEEVGWREHFRLEAPGPA